MYYSDFSVTDNSDYYWVLDGDVVSIAVDGLPIHCSRNPLDWRSWFEWDTDIQGSAG